MQTAQVIAETDCHHFTTLHIPRRDTVCVGTAGGVRHFCHNSAYYYFILYATLSLVYL